MEKAARNENENLGTIVSIINTLTERADTRNWQSLPYSIAYTRIYLPEGHHTLYLNFEGDHSGNNAIEVDVRAGQTTFYTFHTMNSRSLN